MPPSFLQNDPRFQDPLSKSVLGGGPMATNPQTSNGSTNAFQLNPGAPGNAGGAAPGGFTIPNLPNQGGGILQGGAPNNNWSMPNLPSLPSQASPTALSNVPTSFPGLGAPPPAALPPLRALPQLPQLGQITNAGAPAAPPPPPPMPAQSPFAGLSPFTVPQSAVPNPFAGVPVGPQPGLGIEQVTHPNAQPDPIVPPAAAAPVAPPPEGHPGNFATLNPTPGYAERQLATGNLLADPEFTRWEPWMSLGDFGGSIPDQWKDARYYADVHNRMYDQQDQGE